MSYVLMLLFPVVWQIRIFKTGKNILELVLSEITDEVRVKQALLPIDTLKKLKVCWIFNGIIYSYDLLQQVKKHSIN